MTRKTPYPPDQKKFGGKLYTRIPGFNTNKKKAQKKAQTLRNSKWCARVIKYKGHYFVYSGFYLA